MYFCAFSMSTCRLRSSSSAYSVRCRSCWVWASRVLRASSPSAVMLDARCCWVYASYSARLAADSCCLVTSCVLISSTAADAFLDESKSRAAFAARSRPSGSKPVTELPPPPPRFGALSGVISLDGLSLSLLRFPPNIFYLLVYLFTYLLMLHRSDLKKGILDTFIVCSRLWETYIYINVYNRSIHYKIRSFRLKVQYNTLYRYIGSLMLNVGCWMLDVGCWMLRVLNVVQGVYQ